MDILLGYDGSDCARAALEAAIDLARSLGDRVVIAYADAPPDRLRGEEWKEHHRALRELGESETTEALEQARAAGVEAKVELVPQRPAQALLALSERPGVRMIVVGTHGEGPSDERDPRLRAAQAPPSLADSRARGTGPRLAG